ncbi:MAG: hypothetical protein CL930_14680 [Deltaproteobacteria bacterium]|nr:hypothetical protein [Deltaproteobacteria bacterium]
MINATLNAIRRRTLPEPDANPQPPGSGPHVLGNTPPSDWTAPETWPNSPAAWVSQWDIAARTLQLLAHSAWSKNTLEEQRTLSGHARAHLQHLRRNRTSNTAESAALCDAAQVIVATHFNGWPESNRWIAQGYRRLESSLAAQMGAANAPTHDPLHLEQCLWAVALAYATTNKAGQAFPASILRTWRSGVQTTVDIAGTSGRIPILDGERTPILPLGPTPITTTLAHLAYHWTDLDCPRHEGEDLAFTRLTDASPQSRDWQTHKHWHANSWRDQGFVTAHNGVHHLLGRANDQAIWWLVNGHRLVHGSATNLVRTGAQMEVARIDGRVFHMKLGDRVARMEGARLAVTDTAANRMLRWTFPTGTTITPTPKGFSATTPLGNLNITAANGWIIDEHSIVHRDGNEDLTVRIELK